MKKLYPSVFFIGCVIVLQPFIAQAQCSVEIKVPITTGRLLKAYLSDSTIKTLTWFLNGNAVYTAHNTGFKVKGNTAAGSLTSGSGANQLYAPNDVSVDAAGNIFILDGFNNRVQKWAPGATEGITVAGGNGIGSASNQLFLPQGFYVDPSGNIYIADLYNHRVQKWAPGATAGITVAGGNGYGSAANQLAFPHDVFVDASGNVYITDGDNNRIQKWAPGATSGVTVAGGNGYGSADNQLNSPFSVFVDESGNIYISDRANSRIQKWAAGATSGITVAGGSPGSDSTQLNDPRGIYVDAQGDVYIADYFNNRIQKWMPGASYGVTVAGLLQNGKTAVQFFNPSGVYVMPAGYLYVADEGNNRVQKFDPALHINKSFRPEQAGTYNVIATYKSGCVARSNEIVINDVHSFQSITNSNIVTSDLKEFVAYPNPAKQIATLKFSSTQKEKYTINITDLTGKIILHSEGITNGGTNIIQLNVSNFANGVYIVNLIKGGKEKQTLKLIKG